MLDGIPLTIDYQLCQLEFVGWKKNHRKARINKKWHKKYGPILRCKGHVFRVGSKIVCCPCSWTSLAKLWNAK